MNLTDVRLIVVDMDGTLLSPAHEVSQEFWPLFERLRQLDIAFAAASGRQYGSIVGKLAPIADRISILAENGAFAKHDGRVLVQTTLPEAAVVEVISRLSSDPQIKAVLCSTDEAFITSGNEGFRAFMSEFYTSYVEVDDLLSVSAPIVKIALYHPEDSEKHIYPHLDSLTSPVLVKVSSKYWVDISHPDANKGHALKILQAELGISRAQTLAIGDFNNDLEMLAQAEYSYAMGNAHPRIVEAAKYQTTGNDDLGVEKVLAAVIAAHEGRS